MYPALHPDVSRETRVRTYRQDIARIDRVMGRLEGRALIPVLRLRFRLCRVMIDEGIPLHPDVSRETETR